MPHLIYTDHPDVGPPVVFPRESLRLLYLITLLLTLMLITYILGRRTSKLASLTALSIARIACLMVWILSAAYVFAALVLSFGTGMSKSTSTCNASSLLCLCFYSSSKFWLYLFLLEKLRVVQAVKKPRLRSKQYLALLTMISVPCTAFIVLMVFGRRTDIDSRGTCHMGLELYSTLPIACFDIIVVSFLTYGFCTPLIRDRDIISPMIKRVATKSLVAAIVAISSTLANVIYLSIAKRKLAWLCLLTCTMDIIVNAIVLFVVTIRTDDEGSSNGNEKREQQAIRALGSGSVGGGKNSRGVVGDRDDHLDMLEALAGDLRLGPISGARRPSQPPVLACKCSSSSLATSERMARQSSYSTTSAGVPDEAASACEPPLSGQDDDKDGLESRGPSRVARLLYQSPASSSTSAEGDPLEMPPETPGPALTLGPVRP